MLVSVVFHDYFLEFMLGYQIQNLTKQTYRAIFHYGALPLVLGYRNILLRTKVGSAFFANC